MKSLLAKLIEPTLLIDEKKCRSNIENMVAKARENQLELRPHSKTHQSHIVGRWLRESGVKKIAVSSIRMAQYFAADGWQDIAVAFPTNIREINRINELAGSIQLSLLVENIEAVAFLEKELPHSIKVFIKADTGYHRTGLEASQFDRLDELVESISGASMMELQGFLSHAGHSYKARGVADIEAVHQNSLTEFEKFRQRYEAAHPNLTYSVGDTPTCSAMSTFGIANEIRPGNFVFYDLSQTTIGACSLEEIAVVIACPVVAKHPNRSEIVLYGGGVHFSKDRNLHPNGGQTYYGLIVEWTDNGWQGNWQNSYIKSLSQEHSIVKATTELMEKTEIGDMLGILPIHSCMMANLMKRYQTLDGKWINMMAYP